MMSFTSAHEKTFVCSSGGIGLCADWEDSTSACDHDDIFDVGVSLVSVAMGVVALGSR